MYKYTLSEILCVTLYMYMLIETYYAPLILVGNGLTITNGIIGQDLNI